MKLDIGLVSFTFTPKELRVMLLGILWMTHRHRRIRTGVVQSAMRDKIAARSSQESTVCSTTWTILTMLGMFFSFSQCARGVVHANNFSSTDEFTPGQIERGSNMYANLRAGVADRFTAPVPLGNAAINAGRNCAGESTYIGVRRWTDGQFDVHRCEQHCRETSQFNLLRNRPACRFYNTYVQRRNGTHEFQACALYTQEWKADAARNTGQVRGSDRITISDSVMATDVDNNGVRSC